MRPLPTSAVTDFSQYAGLRAEARANDPAALQKTAKQFESLLLQQMLKSMRQASGGEDLMGGEQTQFYQDMFDQQLSVQMASGKGIGLADLMVRQMKMSQGIADPPDTAATKDAAGKTAGVIGLPIAPRATPAAATAAAGTVQDTPFHPKTPQEFIDAVLPHAEKAAQQLGIPARVLVAQAALESGWGKHQIRHADGTASFNLFGIKADKGWEGERVRTSTHEYQNGDYREQSAHFRAYGSIGEAFDDYARFLQSNPRYAEALRHQGNAQHFTVGLQQAGYATDPRYAQKILRIAYGPTMQLAMNKAATVTA